MIADVKNVRSAVFEPAGATLSRATGDQWAGNAETFTALVRSNPFGIYVIDSGFSLIEFSQGARAVFAGIDPLIGRDLSEILRIIWTEPFATEAIARFCHTLATGEPYVSLATVEQRANTKDVEAYDWRIERISLPDGQFGVVCYFYDLSERNAYETQLHQALRDNELLAREIDHRVKNSLTVVSSLLTMQRRNATSSEAADALAEAANRVLAVARIHEGLHKSHQLGVIAFGSYLHDLCRDLSKSLQRPDVTMDLSIVDIDLPGEIALPLALIANELVTNAFKHGGTGGATAISVALEKSQSGFRLTVHDDGAGMPSAVLVPGKSLGFQLVRALGRQIGAAVTIPEPGTPARFSLSGPLRRAETSL